MDRCVVCSVAIDNHSYLIEDSPLFFTHCFECQHNLLIERSFKDERYESHSNNVYGKGRASY